jgi:hypothetical protein
MPFGLNWWRSSIRKPDAAASTQVWCFSETPEKPHRLRPETKPHLRSSHHPTGQRKPLAHNHESSTNGASALRFRQSHCRPGHSDHANPACVLVFGESRPDCTEDASAQRTTKADISSRESPDRNIPCNHNRDTFINATGSVATQNTQRSVSTVDFLPHG